MKIALLLLLATPIAALAVWGVRTQSDSQIESWLAAQFRESETVAKIYDSCPGPKEVDDVLDVREHQHACRRALEKSKTLGKDLAASAALEQRLEAWIQIEAYLDTRRPSHLANAKDHWAKANATYRSWIAW